MNRRYVFIVALLVAAMTFILAADSYRDRHIQLTSYGAARIRHASSISIPETNILSIPGLRLETNLTDNAGISIRTNSGLLYLGTWNRLGKHYAARQEKALFGFRFIIRGPTMGNPGSFLEFVIPLWTTLIVVLSLTLISVGLSGRRIRKRTRTGCCAKCGFDLRGSIGDRCPECGSQVSLSVDSGHLSAL
jgi:hypothetical protein